MACAIGALFRSRGGRGYPRWWQRRQLVTTASTVDGDGDRGCPGRKNTRDEGKRLLRGSRLNEGAT